MVRQLLKLILFAVLLGLPSSGSWGIAPESHFLSFEQRWVMSYLLAGVGEAPEIQNLYNQKLLEKLKIQSELDPQTIEVTSFSQFLKAYRGEWPNTESLQKDIEILEKTPFRAHPEFKANTENLQADIDTFIQEQNRYVAEKMQPYVYHIAIQPGNEELLDPVELLKLLRKIRTGDAPESALIPLIQQNSDQAADMLSLEFRKISSLGKAVAQQMNGDEVFNAIMTKILGGYFENLSLKSKKQIVSQILGYNLDASPIERFEIMVMNSGPQFQKLLQIVAREAGVGEEVLAVFQKLESKTRPVPPVLVADIINPEKEAYGIVDFDLKPIGIGTMAQVHKGTLKSSDGTIEPVVIRFIKPGMADRIEEDRLILGKVAPEIDNDPVVRQAGMPKLTPLVDDLTQTVKDELKLKETTDLQNRGNEVYARNHQVKVNGSNFELVIHVPRVYEIKQPTQLMVQEFAEGTKLDKVQELVKDSYPDLKQTVIEQISKMWMTELLFNTGFFHSDMHQGNFMVEVKGVAKKIHVNILDFGMGGELTELQRRSFLLLAAGSQIDSPKMVSEALWAMSQQSLNRVSREEFDQRVKAKVAETRKRKMQLSTTGIFAWSMEQGIRFNQSVISVNRGFSILEKMLKESGSDFSMETIGQAVAEDNIWQLKKDLRKTGFVNYWDLVKLWYSNLKAPRPVDIPARMCKFVLLK